MAVHRDNFYITLPSNSSMKYFPENTTDHFVTQLPAPLTLSGDWSVALIELSIPMTFSHIPKYSNKNTMHLIILNSKDGSINEKDIVDFVISEVPYGVFTHIGLYVYQENM